MVSVCRQCADAGHSDAAGAELYRASFEAEAGNGAGNPDGTEPLAEPRPGAAGAVGESGAAEQSDYGGPGATASDQPGRQGRLGRGNTTLEALCYLVSTGFSDARIETGH